MLQILFSYLPIILIIWLMVKKNSMPSSRALPLVAGLTYLIMLVVFDMDANLVHANVFKGFLVSWTPILIIAGAIFMFKTMEATGGLIVIRQWLNSITENKLAQLMIVGWAFPFLIEGASGFGTPAAIAAPILVGLGFPPVRVAVLTLMMNSVPVSFGAIGTPTWFGFSEISLSEAEILEVSFKTAIINSAAALVIPALALMFVLKPGSVLRNYGFIILSVLSAIIPYTIIARYNYEFPSLIGGAIGLLVTVFLAGKKIGLTDKNIRMLDTMAESGLLHSHVEEKLIEKPSNGRLLRASFPLWGTILILVITRIPQLGIKGLITAAFPALELSLGSLGDLSISTSLVVGLENIFLTGESWSHSILYVPSFIPFGLVSVLVFWLEKTGRSKAGTILKETLEQMQAPVLALFGALIFVSLMMMGGNMSPVTLIGNQLATATGGSWQYFSSFLGALGAFFSGSATISNLTFGGIQDSIAANLGLERTTILALQSVGAAMGNMICINNIVAVSSILAIGNKEGAILKKTVWGVVVYGIIAGVMGGLI